MLHFIVPQFSRFYTALNTPLPTLTQCIVEISQALQTISPTKLIIFLLILWLLQRFYKKYPSKLQAISEPFLLKLPIISSFKKKNILNTFCQTLSILFNNDHHLPTTITIAAQATNSPKFIQSIKKARLQLEQGTSLHHALKANPLFPNMAVQMIHAGETSHQLDIILKQLAKLYENELKQSTDVFIKLLEPLNILFIGALIALIVIALYLPVFQLNSIL